MELHTVLEAGLRAGEAAGHAVNVLGAAVSQAGDSVNHLSAGLSSDCCTSNNYPTPDPNPNL